MLSEVNGSVPSDGDGSEGAGAAPAESKRTAEAPEAQQDGEAAPAEEQLSDEAQPAVQAEAAEAPEAAQQAEEQQVAESAGEEQQAEEQQAAESAGQTEAAGPAEDETERQAELEAKRQAEAAEAEAKRQAALEARRQAEARRLVELRAALEVERQAELEAKKRAEAAEAEAERRAELEARRQAELEAERQAEQRAAQRLSAEEEEEIERAAARPDELQDEAAEPRSPRPAEDRAAEPRSAKAAEPRPAVAELSGDLRQSRSGAVRVLLLVTGLALVRWLVRGLGGLLGYRHPSTLRLNAWSLEIFGERQFVGISLGKTRQVIPLSAVQRVHLVARSGAWSLFAAVVALALAGAVGATLVLWGISGREASWIGLGLVVIGLGVVLDALAYLWVRWRRSRGLADVEIRATGGRLRLCRAPLRGAERLMSRLARG